MVNQYYLGDPGRAHRYINTGNPSSAWLKKEFYLDFIFFCTGTRHPVSQKGLFIPTTKKQLCLAYSIWLCSLNSGSLHCIDPSSSPNLAILYPSQPLVVVFCCHLLFLGLKLDLIFYSIVYCFQILKSLTI